MTKVLINPNQFINTDHITAAKFVPAHIREASPGIEAGYVEDKIIIGYLGRQEDLTFNGKNATTLWNVLSTEAFPAYVADQEA